MAGHVITGPATLLGDFVSADVVLPARHSFLPPAEMAEQVLYELGEDVNRKVRTNSILVVGQAFGYGTGRESPARALRAAGVKVVVGGPFARMFFRNAINNGILLVDCPELVAAGIADGDVLEIDIDHEQIRWKDRTFGIPKVPDIVKKIIEAGSLIDYGRDIVRRRQHDGAANGS